MSWFRKGPPRLRELASHNSPLSYLLFLASSVATVLTLGHSQIPELMASDPVVRVIAGLSLFLLVASVYAADMSMLASLSRVPVLARNRAHGALVEHLAYIAFVLAVEMTTYGIVMAVLDTTPHALLTSAPLVPLSGPLFVSQIVARAVLLGWTGLQLFIVRRPLPPVPATLVTRAQELIGGDALARLGALDTSRLSVWAAVDAYLVMCRRPRRIAGWWNAWLVRRDIAREAEEDRTRGAIVQALAQLEGEGDGGNIVTSRPPTGPGSPLSSMTTVPAPQSRPLPGVVRSLPAHRAASAASARRPAASAASKRRTRSDEAIGAEVRALLTEDTRMGLNEIVRRAHVSIKDASRWRAAILAESQGQSQAQGAIAQ